MRWLSSPVHRGWLASETDRLLTFSRGSVHPDGGFAWLDRAGEPEHDRPRGLWITCRMTHVFALGHLLGRPGCGLLVDHGLRALETVFLDAVHGGWYAEVTVDGPVTREKTAYEHAFVVLAASSATAAGRPGGSELLHAALAGLDRFWDDDAGMMVEQWDESFSTLDDYRGVNANMHSVEALLAAADVTGDRYLLDRALRITTRVVHELARGNQWRLPEHFDSEWQPEPDYNRDQPAHPFRPFGATVGHWLEWARLALHLRAAIGDSAPDWLLDDAVGLFDAAAREGWSADGSAGFVYTVDWSGRPVVRERMHWVAAEATAAAAALWHVTGEDRFAARYEEWWDHIATYFIDPVGGSWFHELDAEGRPSGVTWPGKPDTYHAVQATLIPRLPLAPSLATALRDGYLSS